MMPLDLTFRRMLLKYIPQVTEYDLRKYESLIALRHQLIHEQTSQAAPVPNTGKSSHPAGGGNIGSISDEAQKIFGAKKVEKYFDNAHRLEIATRQYALAQGKFLQISPTVKGDWNYLKKSSNYRWVQLQTLPGLWFNKIKFTLVHIFTGKAYKIQSN